MPTIIKIMTTLLVAYGLSAATLPQQNNATEVTEIIEMPEAFIVIYS
jgi:hypothetical protein